MPTYTLTPEEVYVDGVDVDKDEVIVLLNEIAAQSGASAYQIAVANGYSGTEEEWLASLHGDPGMPGAGVYQNDWVVAAYPNAFFGQFSISATELHVHHNADSGFDMGILLGDLEAGDGVVAQNLSDSTIRTDWSVTGPAVLSGDYYVIPVTLQPGVPQGTVPTAGMSIMLSLVKNTGGAALTVANAADTKANQALAENQTQNLYMKGSLPGLDPGSSMPVNWSLKDWTNAEVYNPSLSDGLADMTHTVGLDSEGYLSVTLPGSTGQATTKKFIKRRKNQDVLLLARVIATGVSGTGCYLGLYYGRDGAVDGGRARTNTVLTEGVNYIWHFSSKADMYHGDGYRPFARRNGATGTVQVQWIQPILLEDGVLPFLALRPPTDNLTDSIPTMNLAMSILNSMTGRRVLEGSGITYAVAQPVENTAGALLQNFTFRAFGDRLSWAGGSPDKGGAPRQKGVVRSRSAGCRYHDVDLQCSGGWFAEEVVETNCVYTRYLALANGFEDAPIGTGSKATAITYLNCLVDDFDHYGLRYSAESGGGHNNDHNRARKRPPYQTPEGLVNADANTGYPMLIDANDGYLRHGTYFGGEAQIYQRSGGTFEVTGNHPWQGASGYDRRYFGTIGTIIDTGIQVRTGLGQVGTYDTSKVSVSIRASDWTVLVTMLVTVPQSEAVRVPIRRDEIAMKFEGWQVYCEANYIDGGTVRCDDNNISWIGGYGLAATMDQTQGGFPPTIRSWFEFRPATNSAVPPERISWMSDDTGLARILRYPRSGQSAFSASNLRYSDDTLAAQGGINRKTPQRFESIDTSGLVAMFRAPGTRASIALARQTDTLASAGRFCWGTGSPEGVQDGGRMSFYLREDGAAGSRVYLKTTADGTLTGWVATPL